MNIAPCSIARLHRTKESVDEAIRLFREGGDSKEQFLVYPLDGRFTKKGIFHYILPCSLADQFNDVAGEYGIKNEVPILNKELETMGLRSSIRVGEFHVLVNPKAKNPSVKITTYHQPYIGPYIFTSKEAPPFIGNTFPKGESLNKL